MRCATCGQNPEAFCQCPPSYTPRPTSPYEVPCTSVVDAPRRSVNDGELLPFERDQLQRLINQFDASSPRIKAAFGEAIAPMISSVSLSDSRPKVVRFRG